MPQVDEALVESVMRTLVLRQQEHRDCCTSTKLLVWFDGSGAREAVREARRRGWAEYVDPTGWRAKLVEHEADGQRPVVPLCRKKPAAFVWGPGNGI